MKLMWFSHSYINRRGKPFDYTNLPNIMLYDEVKLKGFTINLTFINAKNYILNESLSSNPEKF